MYAVLFCVCEITQGNTIIATAPTTHILKELEILMQLVDFASLFIVRVHTIANYNQYI